MRRSIELDYDSIPVPLIVFSKESGIIIDANEAFENEYSNISFIKNKKLDSVFNPLPKDLGSAQEDKHYYSFLLPSGNSTLIELIFNSKSRQGEVIGIVQELFPSFRTLKEIHQPIFKAIFDKARDIILVADNDGNFIEVNDTACKKLGYSRKEFLELNVRDITHEVVKKGTQKKWEDFIESGVDEGEYILQTNSGDFLHTHYRAIANIRPGNHLSILRDISEEKRSRDLVHIQKNFDKLINAVPDGIMVVDRSGKIIFSNKNAGKMFGYKRRELIGKSVEDLMPDHLQKKHQTYRYKYSMNPVSRSMETGLDLVGKRQDGTLFPIDISLGPFKNDSGLQFIAIIRDITKFKKANDKIKREKNFVKLLNKISSTANESESLTEIIAYSIQQICDYMDWQVGHAYLRSQDNPDVFVSSKVWFLEDPEKFESFKVLSETTTFKSGEGMVGRIIKKGNPEWVENAHTDQTFIRRYEGLDLGIRSSFGLPILEGGRVVGVVEFFSEHVIKDGSDILDRLSSVGIQIGRVSERVRGEERLQASENRYRALFETARHGILLVKEMKIIDCNKQAGSIFEVPDDYLRGKQIENVFSNCAKQEKPNIRNKLYHYIKTALNNDGDTISFECEYLKKNGEAFHAEVDILKVVIDGEKVAQINISDITTKKQRDKLIQKNAELFKQLFENTPIGVVMLDKAGNVERINKSFQTLFGYRLNEIKGKELDSLLIPEEKREDAQLLTQQAIDGEVFQIESTRIHKNGSEVPVLICASPVVIEGNMLAVFGMYADLRKLKTAEEALKISENRLKEAQKIARIGNWEMIHETGEIYWSDEVFRIFEIEKNDKNLSYEDFLLFVHPEDRDELNSIYIDSIQNQTDYQFIHRVNLKDDKIKYVQEQCRHNFDEDGNPIRSIGTVQDITKRILAQKEIQKSLQEKEVLLSEIHHRVKNNLAIVTGLLNLESAQLDNERSKEALRNSVMRISTMALIHEILYSTNDFSHIPIREFVKDLISEIEALKQLQFPVDIELSFDEVRLNINQAVPLGLILNEIISNAYKHAFFDKETKKIEISLHQKNNLISISIQDNGIGFPETFDITSESSLGFVLIRSLCEQLDGDIEAGNKDGAYFEIKFENKNVKGAGSNLNSNDYIIN